jgi:hypothetical protein
MMKHLKVLIVLLLAAFPAVLSSQTVTAEYMKVTEQSESLYLKVEQEWKKIHKARIDAGLIQGWTLYRNVGAGYKDPYQYVTITWYDNMTKAVTSPFDGLDESVWGAINEDLINQTGDSRVLAHRDFSYNMESASGSHESKYIVINRMRPTPGNWDAYVKSEREIFKPMFDESIKEGHRNSWGLWQTWPYKEGEIRLVTVDGFDSLEQRAGEDLGDLFKKVFPDKDMNKVAQEVTSFRDQAEVELWERVDSVWPEPEEE